MTSQKRGAQNGEVHSPPPMGQKVPAKKYVGIHGIMAIRASPVAVRILNSD